MANIEKISTIKRETLSREHYFQSLLERAYIVQLLSEAELEKIQFDCLALLAKRTERFNSGDSSSIRIEKAQDILTSIMFTVGAQLKTYENPDDALAALQKDGVESVFAEGLKRIDRLIKRTKMRHAVFMSRLFQTENVFYAATIVDGIRGFFKLYSPEFTAHEIHITADYPVYNKAERLLGIEFIEQYLEQLYCENSLCNHFSAEAVHHLLCGYDEHYEELLFNIYEPVLAAALGCVLAGTNIERLEITPAAESILLHQFSEKNRSEIEGLLTTALIKLGEQLSLPESLMRYANQSLPLLAAAIDSSLQMGTLHRVFIEPSYPENHQRLFVSYGEKMDDKLYRKVLAEFMHCHSTADKTDVLRESVHSLADFNDILLDAELSEDEMVVFLKELSPAEFAALTKKYSSEYEMSFTELRDSEKVLCGALHSLTALLPSVQQELLKKAVKILEVN